VIITKFAQELTHPKREEETTLGNLIADAFAETGDADIVLVGSGSIRVKKLGPVMTLKDFLACFPYDDSITKYTISGEKLKIIFSHFMRKENRNGEGECYQVNSKVKAEYDDSKGELVSLTVDAMPVEDNKLYTICLQGYHFSNCQSYLNVTNDDLLESGLSKVVTTSAQEVLEEYFRNNQNISMSEKGRLVYIK